jgi:uncharacterized protein (TIGR02246 family)
MVIRRLVPCTIALTLACAAPAPEQAAPPAAPDPAAVRQTIEAANARQVDAILKGDAQAAVANYADDAVFMNPGAPAAQGKAALVDLFTGMIQQGSFSDVKMQTVDVVVSGDLAVENGTYRWTLTPKGGKAMPDSGKYMTVWRKQADGGWKIIRDINNSDVPPKP